MKSIELSEVAALVPLVTSNGGEPILLTRDGLTIATIVPTSEQDVESLLLSVNPQFQVILERAQQRFETEGGISAADARNRLELPPKN